MAFIVLLFVIMVLYIGYKLPAALKASRELQEQEEKKKLRTEKFKRKVVRVRNKKL